MIKNRLERKVIDPEKRKSETITDLEKQYKHSVRMLWFSSAALLIMFVFILWLMMF